MYNSIKLEFMGFDPKYKIKTFIAHVAEKLHLNSPSDSAMKMVIEKGRGAVKASCQIASKAGTYGRSCKQKSYQSHKKNWEKNCVAIRKLEKKSFF